jgi:hypothetical protein
MDLGQGFSIAGYSFVPVTPFHKDGKKFDRANGDPLDVG